MRLIDQQENGEAKLAAFEHVAGAFPPARLVLFVSSFQRGGAHPPVVIVDSVLQVAHDDVAWSSGLRHSVLVTHDGDSSPKSLSPLINLTEISDHARIGVQWRCNGHVLEQSRRNGHFDVRHGYID